MKVLFFIYAVNGGGAERVTATLASHWVEKGWEVTIVSLVGSGRDAYELAPGVRRMVLDMGGESRNLFHAVVQNFRRAAALRRLLLELKPDAALAMESRANVLLPIAARGLRQMTVIGSERTFPPRSPLGTAWNALRRRIYGKLDAVVALTSECAAWLRINTSAHRVPVIPNPVDWPLTGHEPKVDPALFCRSGRKILLAAGRLITEKNIDVLIEVFSALATRHGDWDMVVIGEGSERAALEERIQSKSLAQRIFLAGRVGNPGDWYRHAHLYVMASQFEGFPNTLAEACAHGVPAVSFDCDTGPRDIIRHGMDGLLVPPGNSRGLQDALNTLMGDDGLRARYAERAVDARTRFSIERISSLWEDLFEECLRERRRATAERFSEVAHES
jgi:glycosyltransferase involved in cell wall biosynthesis